MESSLTMRRAVMLQAGRIHFDHVPIPAVTGNQVLLRVRRIGVCGSDVHVWHGKHPFVRYPLVQGHEFAATVEAVGPGVKGIAPGSKVTATPQEVCGSCRACRSGRYNVCQNLRVRGFQAPGCAADFFLTEADKIVALPDTFTFDQGALVEPVAVAVHATGRAGDLVGKNVVVSGAGPIGNLVAQACKVRGAAKVLVADITDFRLAMARQCGADAVCNVRGTALSNAVADAFGNAGFSVAFEVAGAESSLSSLVAGIDKGGTVVAVAVFGERPPLDMSVICEHELNLTGTMMYRHDDWLTAVEWMAAGSIKVEPLITRHFSFEEYAAAYAFIDSAGEQAVKVIIDVDSQ